MNGTLLAYRNACAACGSLAGTRARWPAGSWPVPRCSARFDLPRAGRGGEDAALQLGAGAAAARRPGASAGRGTGVSGRSNGRPGSGPALSARRRTTWSAGSAGWPQAPAAPRPGGRRPGARRRALRPVRQRDRRRTTATCSTWTSGGSTARARPAGACARATREYRPVGHARGVAARPGAVRRALGQLRHPDRAGVLHAQQRGRRRGGAVPEPGGRRPSPSWTCGRGTPLCADNPVLEGLEADAEGLIVNRMAEPHQHAIAPIDDCYRLVGIVKASWEGISGGPGLERRDRRVLRRAARAGGGGVSEGAAAATSGRRRGRSRAGVRRPRRRGGAPRGGAAAALHRRT